MFSLLGDDDLCLADVRVEEKKGDAFESELSAGDNIGGLFDGADLISDRVHGAVNCCSETADNAGDTAIGDALC